MVREGGGSLPAYQHRGALERSLAGKFPFEVTSSLVSPFHCLSEGHLSVLMRGTDAASSQVDAQVGVERQRKVGWVCARRLVRAHKHPDGERKPQMTESFKERR